MSLEISPHALQRFREQTPNPNHRSLSDEEISKLLLSWWEIGNPQTSIQFGFATKFSKYGDEDSEHRKAAGWVMTRVEDTIVTVHYKTLQERRRDKRKRLKANQKKRKKR